MQRRLNQAPWTAGSRYLYCCAPDRALREPRLCDRSKAASSGKFQNLLQKRPPRLYRRGLRAGSTGQITLICPHAN